MSSEKRDAFLPARRRFRDSVIWKDNLNYVKKLRPLTVFINGHVNLRKICFSTITI